MRKGSQLRANSQASRLFIPPTPQHAFPHDLARRGAPDVSPTGNPLSTCSMGQRPALRSLRPSPTERSSPAYGALAPARRYIRPCPTEHSPPPDGAFSAARRSVCTLLGENLLLPFGTISPSGWRIFSIRVEDFLHQGGGFPPPNRRDSSDGVEDFISPASRVFLRL